jgi:hypothetical protein
VQHTKNLKQKKDSSNNMQQLETPMDRSYLYNNAGVRMMGSGNIVVALDLFRGALESKLSYERAQHNGNALLAAIPLPIQRCVTPDLSEMLCDLSDDSDNDVAMSVSAMEDNEATSRFLVLQGTSIGTSTPNRADAAEVVGQEYSPFFFQSPFELAVEPHLSSTELTSSTIVFNLGLVHHHQNRNSPRAAAFYEISAALLANEPDSMDSVLLKIALLNNFGIWCFENGDSESLRTCMDHLATVVENCAFRLNPTIAQGVRANVAWIMMQP